MKRSLRLLAVLFVVALIASACSSDNSDPVVSTTDVAPTTTVDAGHDDGDVDDGHDDEKEAEEVDGHGHGEEDLDPSVKAYKVVAGDFTFSPELIEIEGETFTIEMSNVGDRTHDLVIEGEEDQGGPHIKAGESGSVTYTLEAGTYTVYCTLGSHREKGQEGTLIVTVDDHDDG